MINNISFKARLDTTKLTQNKDRWEEINKEFERITKDNPNDVFELSNDESLEFFLETKHEVGEAKLKKTATKSLLSLKDKSIARRLKKIYKILSDQEYKYELGEDFLKSLGKKYKHSKIKNFDEDVFWENLANKVFDDKKDEIKKDSFLSKGFEYI